MAEATHATARPEPGGTTGRGADLDRGAAPPAAAPPAAAPPAAAPPAAAPPAAAPPAAAIRAAVVGMSVSPTCGVRAHAGLLAGALARERIDCSEHWLERRGDSLGAARAQVGAWTGALAAELEAGRPDAVLLHYSVFAYSHRGLPLFVAPVLAALRRTRLPVVAMLHELAYPWGLGGWRGGLWALTQRMLLIDVMRLARAAVVTADFRAEWLASRRWLARRPIGLAPVFSNLPPPTAGPRGEHEAARVGLFGYSHDERATALVLDAVRLLERRGVRLELTLLGAPGRDSALAERWLRAARARGLERPPSFAGPLPAQELSDALAACEVLLFADGAGPSSRKGTLAGSLASGRPLVAVDGRRTWRALVREQAACVVAPSAQALAGAVARLLEREDLRDALGARGREFAERRMGLALSAEVVGGLLGEVVR